MKRTLTGLILTAIMISAPLAGAQGSGRCGSTCTGERQRKADCASCTRTDEQKRDCARTCDGQGQQKKQRKAGGGSCTR